MRHVYITLFVLLIGPNLSQALSLAPPDSFYQRGNEIAFGKHEVPADTESFQVFYPSDYFARDKNQVFFKHTPVPNVNPDSFKVTNDVLGTDGKTVVLLDNTKEEGFRTQTFNDFKILSPHYYEGDGQVYFLNIREPDIEKLKNAELVLLKGVKPDEFYLMFQKVGADITDVFNVMAQTSSHVLLCDKAIPYKKTMSAPQILSSKKEVGFYFTVDKKVYYAHGCKITLVKNTTPENFKVLTHLFVTNGKEFIKYGKPVTFTYKGQEIKPNIKEFIVIENVWGKYQDSLYYIYDGQFHEYKNVDLRGFEILRNYCKEGMGCVHLAKDSRYYFYRSGQSLIDTEDGQISHVLHKLPNHRKAVYLNGLLLNQVDPDTYSNIDSSHYGMDKNSVFYNNVAVPGVDRKSFKVLDYGYAKDQFSVYLHGRKVSRADALTFKRRIGKFSDRSLSNKNKFWEDKRFIFDQDGKIVQKITTAQ